MAIDNNFQRLNYKNHKVTTIDTRHKFYHAMVCVGYFADDDGRWLIVRNSWGRRWGTRGYCYIHESLFMKGMKEGGAFDYWTLR